MNTLDGIRTLTHVQKYLENLAPNDWTPDAKWDAIEIIDRLRRDLRYGTKCNICGERVDARHCTSCALTMSRIESCSR